MKKKTAQAPIILKTKSKASKEHAERVVRVVKDMLVQGFNKAEIIEFLGTPQKHFVKIPDPVEKKKFQKVEVFRPLSRCAPKAADYYFTKARSELKSEASLIKDNALDITVNTLADLKKKNYAARNYREVRACTMDNAVVTGVIGENGQKAKGRNANDLPDIVFVNVEKREDIEAVNAAKQNCNKEAESE